MLSRKAVSGGGMVQREILVRWQLDPKSMTQYGRDVAKFRT
jgi:hypothetical protein